MRGGRSPRDASPGAGGEGRRPRNICGSAEHSPAHPRDGHPDHARSVNQGYEWVAHARIARTEKLPETSSSGSDAVISRRCRALRAPGARRPARARVRVDPARPTRSGEGRSRRARLVELVTLADSTPDRRRAVRVRLAAAGEHATAVLTRGRRCSRATSTDGGVSMVSHASSTRMRTRSWL